MVISKQLFAITIIVSSINLFSVSKIFSMNNASQIDFNKIIKQANEAFYLINSSTTMAHNSNNVSLEAFTNAQTTKDALNNMEKQMNKIASVLKQGGALSEKLEKEIQEGIKQLQKEGNVQRQAFSTVLNAVKIENGLGIDQRKELINEKRKADLDLEKLKGENRQKILEIFNPTIIGATTIAVLLSFYSFKYGFPALIDYWKCPYVIS